jgi:hypothetical protein
MIIKSRSLAEQRRENTAGDYTVRVERSGTLLEDMTSLSPYRLGVTMLTVHQVAVSKQ